MRLPEEQRHGLGREIRALRRARGWTQEQLEERASLGQSTISALENGRQDQTSIENLRRLAGAFEISVNVLLRAAGLVEDDGSPAETATYQLPLEEPDERFDPEEIVRYVESKPGYHFQQRLKQQRDRLPRADYVRFCLGVFRAWSSNGHLALSSVELSAPSN